MYIDASFRREAHVFQSVQEGVSEEGRANGLGVFGHGRIRMNLRHAVALALAGWYLMIPPVVPYPGQEMKDAETLMKSGAWLTDVQAPLSRWQVSESYDQASDCEELKDKMIVDSKRHCHSTTWKCAYLLAESQALCIATDYPRLKSQ
jgi:hypothetical protein